MDIYMPGNEGIALIMNERIKLKFEKIKRKNSVIVTFMVKIVLM